MPDLFKDIQDFHEKFGLKYDGEPRFLDADHEMFRTMFLYEEMEEIMDGIATSNMEEIFDGLIDLVYVALGTAYLMGLDFNEGWRRVHEANMAKVRVDHPENSKRGSAFDVVKPEGWEPPYLTDLIRKESGIGDDYEWS